MKRIESQQKAKIIITPNLSSQITCLHNQCPDKQEWSGLMVCEITSGGIEDIDNLVIKCHDVFPMDFGDSTFTSFEGNEDWIRFFEQFPQVSPLNPDRDKKWFLAKLHSHHSMSSFHSTTDTTDLYDNAPKLPFFLSLVVNYACNPFAEIAVQAISEDVTVIKTNWRLKNWKLGKKDNNVKKEKVESTYIIPCDVTYQEASWFVSQLKLVKDKVKPRAYTAPAANHYTSKPWEKKPNGTFPVDAVYTKTLGALTSLFSLGTLDDKDMTPYQAYAAIDGKVQVKDIEQYKKAFKQYFCAEWFDYHFNLTTAYTEEQVIDAVQKFIDYHKDKWIHKFITQALNELKTEHKQLRAF